jgi:ProP effector
MSNSATKVETTIAELVAAFPAAFTLDPKLVRPLKLGIRDQLYGQSDLSRRCITAALRVYCKSVHYLKASKEGAVRIDLAGELAGIVTPTEAHHAKQALAALAKASAKDICKIASSSGGPKVLEGVRTGHPPDRPNSVAPKGKDAGKGTSAAEAVAPGHKRLSLSDLKRAAAVRKAGG